VGHNIITTNETFLQEQFTELLAMCGVYFQQELAFNKTLYLLASLAFGLAIFLASLHALAVILKTIKTPAHAETKPTLQNANTSIPDIINAAKEFIGGLAKAPIWFFLFVAGAGMVWLTTVDTPRTCLTPALGLTEKLTIPAPMTPERKDGEETTKTDQTKA